jgi:hypothetical protein
VLDFAQQEGKRSGRTKCCSSPAKGLNKTWRTVRRRPGLGAAAPVAQAVAERERERERTRGGTGDGGDLFGLDTVQIYMGLEQMV